MICFSSTYMYLQCTCIVEYYVTVTVSKYACNTVLEILKIASITNLPVTKTKTENHFHSCELANMKLDLECVF